MLQDFLESNKLSGKVVSFPSDTTIEKAAESIHLSSNSIAKTVVFFDEKMDFCLVIARKEAEVSIKDASVLFKKKSLEVAGEDEVKKFSEFEKKFFPPISIYGATIAMHESVKSSSTLIFALSYRDFLVINPETILEAAEICDSF